MSAIATPGKNGGEGRAEALGAEGVHGIEGHRVPLARGAKMKMLKQVAAIVAGVIGVAFATPNSALELRLQGPSSIDVDSLLTLDLGVIGGYTGLYAVTVNITAPPGVLDSALGPMSARLADHSLVPDAWYFAYDSTPDAATVFALSLLEPPIDIPVDGGPLFTLSFPVLNALNDQVSLTFSVDFDNETVGSVYSVAVNAVPEPSTVALLLAGLGAIALSRRKRRPA